MGHINNDWREEMKKILLGLSVLFLMSGCDNGTDTLSCTSSSTANGVTTKTKYTIDYKDDDVKHVTITYDYNQDTTNNNTRNTTDDNKVDGVDADTDGMDTDKNTNNNNLDSDDVVDGVVGDAIDGTVDGIKDTILDIAGIKNTYENQMSSYDNIEGFSYKVDVDTDNEYKVIYEIDMDKINDSDLTRFNITRDFSDLKTNYEDLGYTCK